MPRQDRVERVWDHNRLAQQQEHRRQQADAWRQQHLDNALKRALERLHNELGERDERDGLESGSGGAGR